MKCRNDISMFTVPKQQPHRRELPTVFEGDKPKQQTLKYRFACHWRITTELRSWARSELKQYATSITNYMNKELDMKMKRNYDKTNYRGECKYIRRRTKASSGEMQIEHNIEHEENIPTLM
eukprot:1191278-Amphidinium_carterae.1